MTGPEVQKRKPLSPVKPNGSQRFSNSRAAVKPAAHHNEPAVAQSTTKPTRTAHAHQQHHPRGSRIPRATPSPEPVCRTAAAPSPSFSFGQSSKIPRPAGGGGAAVAAVVKKHHVQPHPLAVQIHHQPESTDVAPLAGFHAYSNPLCCGDDDDGYGIPKTAAPRSLATPQAMQILQQVDNITTENDAPDGVRVIMNAYLRTGPQKLSPEPSRDYCIAAPNPAAAAAGMMAAAGAHAPTLTRIPVPPTANAYLRTGAQFLSPEPGKETEAVGAEVPAPAPLGCPHDGFKSQQREEKKELEEVQQQQQEEQSRAPEKKEESEVEGVEEGESDDGEMPSAPPLSVCSNTTYPEDMFADLELTEMFLESDAVGGENDAVESFLGLPEYSLADPLEVRLLAPVNSAGHVDNTTTAIENGEEGTSADPVEESDNAVITLLPDGGDVSEEHQQYYRGGQGGKRPSPVAFALPDTSSSDEEHQQPQQPLVRDQSKQNSLAHLIIEDDDSPGTASTGSFSFGFGGGGGGGAAAGGQGHHHHLPTPDAIVSKLPLPPPLPEDETAVAEVEKQQQTTKPAKEGVVESGVVAEKVAVKKGSKLVRPASAESVDQPNPFASMLNHLMEGGPAHYASPRVARRLPQCQQQQQAFVVDSPQSPMNCTPIHLLPEGVPPSAIPELGKGDLMAWIDRRGMRGMLSSPAAADLRRMWEAVREGAGARAVAESAAAENEALRTELYEARQALEQLGVEHHEALTAAETGQQLAEAEITRAREAAQHMMALADQIQSTFALCEAEKAALAEELELVFQQAAEAENETHAAAAAVPPSAALQEELQLAQHAAEIAAQDAAEARHAARASATELAAIKAELEEAKNAMHVAPSLQASTSSAPADATTPFSKLRARLHAAHEALTAIHASAHKQRPAAAPVSPHLDRMMQDSTQGLNKAQELLEQDTCELHQENSELRALLSGVQARISELSPVRATPSRQNAAVQENDAEADEESSEGCSSPHWGTVTVDFRELRSVLAETSGQLIPVSPFVGNASRSSSDGDGDGDSYDTSAASNSCEMEVDGVRVTNIPPSAVNQVRSMVEYFEELAGVKDMPMTPEAEGLNNNVVESPQEEEEEEERENRQNDDTTTVEREEDYHHHQQREQQDHHHWTPVPPTVERFRAYLPPRDRGSTPLGAAAAASLQHATTTPGEQKGGGAAGLPSTPVDDITPLPQRHHLQTLDALAALQVLDVSGDDDVDDDDIDDFSEFDEDTGAVEEDTVSFGTFGSAGVPPTPVEATGEFTSTDSVNGDGEEAVSSKCSSNSVGKGEKEEEEGNMAAAEENTQPHFLEEQFSEEVSFCPSPPPSAIADASAAKYSIEVSPVDMLAVQRGGTGLHNEVRARLNRLKVELQAARSKLSHVDRGLAAIATPPPPAAASQSTRIAREKAPLALPAPPAAVEAPRRPVVEEVVAVKVEQQQKEDEDASEEVVLSPPSVSAPVAATPSPPPLQQQQQQMTPVGIIAGGTPRTRATTRPSVRFADSVKFSDEDDEQMTQGKMQRKKKIPRTPGMNSSSGARTAAAATVYLPRQITILPAVSPAPPLKVENSRRTPVAIAAPLLGSTSRRQAREVEEEEEEESSTTIPTAASIAIENEEIEVNPLRRLNLGTAYDDDSSSSSGDDDDFLPPHSAGSARSRLAMMRNENSGGGMSSYYAKNTSTPDSRFAINSSGGGGGGGGRDSTPMMSRYSSVSSSNVTPASSAPSPSLADPTAALLSIRPAVGRMWRGGGGGGGGGGRNSRVSASEEKEFRRRAAALKIHVSPYFKRTGGRGQRGDADSSVTVD